MDIVDSQSHLGPGGIDQMLAAMDALGLAAVLIDEFWFTGTPGAPGYTVNTEHGPLPRSIDPTAELAALQYPDRFSYVIKVDRRDPELPAIVRLAGDNPHARAIRIIPGLSKVELAALAAGGYDTMFTAASDAGLPVFVTIPGNAALIRPVAQRFPDLAFIIDHCGMPFGDNMRQGLKDSGIGDDLPDMGTGDKQVDFAAVLRLGDLGNVALKWGHAQGLLGVTGYPYEGLRPLLRQAINAFGAQRIMWASDASVNQTGDSWAELLFWLIHNPDLDNNERASILGGTVRALLNWSA